MRWQNIILCFSDLCDVNLSFGDWLDGLQKTVKNATKQESSSASKGKRRLSLTWLKATISYNYLIKQSIVKKHHH